MAEDDTMVIPAVYDDLTECQMTELAMMHKAGKRTVVRMLVDKPYKTEKVIHQCWFNVDEFRLDIPSWRVYYSPGELYKLRLNVSQQLHRSIGHKPRIVFTHAYVEYMKRNRYQETTETDKATDNNQ